MHDDVNLLNQRILELYQQGYSCKDICSLCNVSVITVRKHLKAAGFNTHTYRKVSACNIQKTILLIKAGYSYKQIEQFLHVSTHLIREIVTTNELIGFAPKYHHPIALQVKPNEVSQEALRSFRDLYLSGKHGMAQSAQLCNVSDKEFLWFVYHLTEKEMRVHNKLLQRYIKKLFNSDVPVTAIAKMMDISPSIVKKILQRAV